MLRQAAATKERHVLRRRLLDIIWIQHIIIDLTNYLARGNGKGTNYEWQITQISNGLRRILTFGNIFKKPFFTNHLIMALLPGFKTTESFKVRAYDIDNQKRITVPALMKCMHEAAMTNAIHLNLSVWDLEPHSISWVLMRKKLTVYRYAILGEQIQVQTYPAGFEKFFTYRDYRVQDAEGKLIADASTTWLLMNTTTRKMSSIPDFISNLEMPDPATCLPRLPLKLPKFGAANLQQNFRVGWHELDFNMHLNNLYYLQWILETLPDEVLQSKQLKDINILYKLECKWKEEILSETEKLSDSSFRHHLIRQSDGKEVVVAETNWE